MARTLDLRCEVAEAIGAFALVFAGCGAIMSNVLSGGAVTHVGIALTFGFVIMVMVLALGHVSGAHLNPAVTLGFAVTGRFPWSRVPTYLVAQAAGATLAAALLLVLLGPVAALGTTGLGPGVGTGQGFGLEAVATFFLMLVIMGVATDERAQPSAAGLAIGGTVLLDALFAGPLTGASMNPARSLGPALVSGQLGELWLYLLAPVAGAVVAALLYEFLRGGEAVLRKGARPMYGVMGRVRGPPAPGPAGQENDRR